MNKGMNALMINLYNPRWKNLHPSNRLTWGNIHTMKQAIKARRRPGNNTNRVNITNNLDFKPTRNKKITLSNYITKNNDTVNYITWNIEKTRPNGRRLSYMTMALNNNLPINMRKLNIGAMNQGMYVNNRGMIRPRNEAALKIQRAWRATKQPGPFSNPVIRQMLKGPITQRLPLTSKKALASALRRPSSYNKELRERSRKVDTFWRAMLQEIKKRSVLNRGYPGLLTQQEHRTLGYHGKKHLEYNPQTRKQIIPVAKRQAAWNNIKSSKPRPSPVSSRAKPVRE